MGYYRHGMGCKDALSSPTWSFSGRLGGRQGGLWLEGRDQAHLPPLH
jgi:hypothetical protein